jgi:hypothetical protein
MRRRSLRHQAPLAFDSPEGAADGFSDDEPVAAAGDVPVDWLAVVDAAGKAGIPDGADSLKHSLMMRFSVCFGVSSQNVLITIASEVRKLQSATHDKSVLAGVRSHSAILAY